MIKKNTSDYYSGCRLRLLAESKGYKVNDTGLYLVTQGAAGKWLNLLLSPQKKKSHAVSFCILDLFPPPLQGIRLSTSVNCKTEKEVFDVLGFPWLEPHERNLCENPELCIGTAVTIQEC